MVLDVHFLAPWVAAEVRNDNSIITDLLTLSFSVWIGEDFPGNFARFGTVLPVLH